MMSVAVVQFCKNLKNFTFRNDQIIVKVLGSLLTPGAGSGADRKRTSTRNTAQLKHYICKINKLKFYKFWTFNYLLYKKSSNVANFKLCVELPVQVRAFHGTTIPYKKFLFDIF